MAEFNVPSDRSSLSLGEGMTLHPGSLSGKVRVEAAASAGTRALSADPLRRSLADEGLRPGPAVSLPPGGAAATRALGAAPLAEPATIDVAVKPGESCVLLVEDANGALTWVLPETPPPVAEAAQGARGLGASLRFKLPPVANAAPDGTRGFSLGLGAKVETFFFDATDALLGPVIHGFAKRWEARHRPSFARRFSPDDFRIDDPAFERLGEAEWRTLAQGPALLFVHGTFSTSGAFRALDPGVVRELSRRYGGRMFAFNHPSLTADPRENALAFLGGVPTGVQLEIDIVCHSRGGLVARQIESLGRTAGNVRVRRIVFVGATNAGTALADDAHMVDFVSRYTTIAHLLPEGSARTAVNALALAVKVLAHGLLRDLEGLAAMNPRGAFMAALNVPGDSAAEYFAIASDFEPKPDSPFVSLRRAEDAAADRVFDRDANDLVVPRDGVFARNGAAGFPIGEGRCLKFDPRDGVVHTEFFGERRTGEQLLEWLEPQAAALARAATGGVQLDDIERVLEMVRSRVLLEFAGDGSRDLGTRAAELSPADHDRLRPHVVNLSNGAFDPGGEFASTPEDVDAIVQEHIPRWAAKLPPGEKLRIVVWAHGGLIGETAGLRIALKHVEWWKENGVYPIYFVWETGLFDALRAILEQVRSKIPGLGRRDLFDVTSDPLIELGARALGGGKIWGAMKRNAALASAANGGALYVAGQLAHLAATPALQHGHPLELHSVGHSAGAIFHSWFLPMAQAQNVPRFKTLQLLAPAITVEDFNTRLAPAIGSAGAAEQAILFTMKRSYEEADNCAGVYRKSLLYLIHHALEPEKRTPVLGLEISLRADAAAARLFGLKGAAGAPGRAVWSMTQEATGRSASTAVHHGDFDDDAATMSSVAANVLDAAEARVRYPGTPPGARATAGEWPIATDWLRGVDLSPGSGAFAAPSPGNSTASAAPARPAAAPVRPAVQPAASPAVAKPAAAGRTGGARRALCVGIDAYEGPNALQGCVNDTRTWRAALETLGFEVDTLLDRLATRQAMIDALTDLVRSARSGDVLVFQYSGHGTQVTDFDGDERDGTDEAFVPYDFEDGAFLVDDDLRSIFMELAEGVNLTCFIDCCHSGSITRMLGRNADASTPDGETRSRYLKQTDQWGDWMRAHERFRQRERSIRGMRSAASGSREIGSETLRWVNFSACDATEVAYETHGSGDFTKMATAALAAGALQRSNRDFQDTVVRAFGERRRQTPQLDCADAAFSALLLQAQA